MRKLARLLNPSAWDQGIIVISKECVMQERIWWADWMFGKSKTVLLKQTPCSTLK